MIKRKQRGVGTKRFGLINIKPLYSRENNVTIATVALLSPKVTQILCLDLNRQSMLPHYGPVLIAR